jgi:hypothetical protein
VVSSYKRYYFEMSANDKAKNKPSRPKRLKSILRSLNAADWEWLEAHRMPRLDPDKDAVELVREERDRDC